MREFTMGLVCVSLMVIQWNISTIAKESTKTNEILAKIEKSLEK